ncbi:MAG: hypothetical protein QOK11_2645, partial [Pseudonocardiales bacterium]|nr:hypothetical protein [Pseudonocardiales bacterium]
MLNHATQLADLATVEWQLVQLGTPPICAFREIGSVPMRWLAAVSGQVDTVPEQLRECQ